MARGVALRHRLAFVVSAMGMSYDMYAPKFHVSPSGCGGGWLNDPNGPFEDLGGRHHIFYQYSARDDGPGPGPGHRRISWGHVVGNLSHVTCLPPALVPGVDGDGSPTPYDAASVCTDAQCLRDV